MNAGRVAPSAWSTLWRTASLSRAGLALAVASMVADTASVLADVFFLPLPLVWLLSGLGSLAFLACGVVLWRLSRST
jgi:hypothetical protein